MLNQLGYRAFEVAITRSPLWENERVVIANNDALKEYAKGYYEGLDREMVLAFVLDDINQLLGVYEVSRGGNSEAEIDPQNVFRPAILLNGSKIILTHNHPTGDLRPSEGDIRSAKAMFMLASLIDLEMADNLVFNADTGEHRSVHAEPEFRRWLSSDLLRIATLMSGEDLTDEQREAADKVQEAVRERDAQAVG
jgi:DNA repair protein RadC